MSLHAILEAILESGAQQVAEIEASAYKRTHEILASARMEASQIEQDACARARSPAFRERARILHRARMEALQIIGNTREALVDKALDQIRGRLAGMRTDRLYPAVLHFLTSEALEELESSEIEIGRAVLEADRRDRLAMESILREMGLKIPVRYTLTTWGGVTARSEDSRVVVINTLETRLERAAPYLRRYLAACFENEPSETEAKRFGELAQVA
jgi:V/A-type H+-transporting ATPase subunit E